MAPALLANRNINGQLSNIGNAMRKKNSNWALSLTNENCEAKIGLLVTIFNVI
jgi:hypothetical protein